MDDTMTTVRTGPFSADETAEQFPAMVSIRMQEFRDLYDTEEGFGYGTSFVALNKPFFGGRDGK